MCPLIAKKNIIIAAIVYAKKHTRPYMFKMQNTFSFFKDPERTTLNKRIPISDAN